MFLGLIAGNGLGGGQHLPALVDIFQFSQRHQLDKDVPQSGGFDGPRNDRDADAAGGHAAQKAVFGTAAQHMQRGKLFAGHFPQLVQGEPVFQRQALIDAPHDLAHGFRHRLACAAAIVPHPAGDVPRRGEFRRVGVDKAAQGLCFQSQLFQLGVGIFLFSDLITDILLGHQWLEAANFIGLWGLTGSVTIVLSHYCSEVYRAKGRPKLSVLSQVLHILCLVPTVLWAINYGFDFLCEMRALVRLTSIVINLVILYFLCRISPLSMLSNIKASLLASLAMIVIYYILPENGNIAVEICYVIICCAVYLFAIMLFSEERKILLNLKNILRK